MIINDLKNINEDSILIYHNNAYINGFAYRALDDVKDRFKNSGNKVEWIKSYVNELHTSFSNIKKFENSTDSFALRLNDLGTPAYVYAFVIKGYKYFADDNVKLSSLFYLLEVITFRAKLINSRANIQERLNASLLEFDGNLGCLLERVKHKLNESWYWGDSNAVNYLNGAMYGNNVLNYLLWRYENSIQNRGYTLRFDNY